MFGWPTKRRRRRILARPFPPAWDRFMEDNVAVVHRLTPAARARLHALVQVFVAEKHWEGCGGLDLTEEHQVTIAAQACLLVLGREADGHDLYRDVDSILVYPSTVITPPRRLGTFEQPRSPIGHGAHLLGEAMLGGPVVLAWDAVLAGGREEASGNVVLHEFAHKLDMANGLVDGTPPLPTRADRARWATICAAAFSAHRARVDAGIPTLLDSYGATNEAEFFAVATEAFFLHPYELAYEHPALYGALARFYHAIPT